MLDNRIISTEEKKEDKFEKSIRPNSLEEYIGQTELKDNLSVFIKASKLRNEVLDHVLLYGPPGLGKTTLSYIIANELNTDIKTTSGPAIEKSGDLAAILSSLNQGDVLFIDEIHRIPKHIEEILYPAMEDFCLDIIVGSENSSRSIKIDLPPFTLVGATTRAGDLSNPLRDRFGIVSKLNYYSDKELSEIIMRTADVLGSKLDNLSSLELAKRSRSTPRIANRLFKRIRDFALVENDDWIELEIINKSLDRLQVDKLGLDKTDYQFLETIIDKFNGGPVGLEAVASSIGEEKTTIEEVYEPFLLQKGLISRTSRGRIVTELGYLHLGREKSKKEGI